PGKRGKRNGVSPEEGKMNALKSTEGQDTHNFKASSYRNAVMGLALAMSTVTQSGHHRWRISAHHHYHCHRPPPPAAALQQPPPLPPPILPAAARGSQLASSALASLPGSPDRILYHPRPHTPGRGLIRERAWSHSCISPLRLKGSWLIEDPEFSERRKRRRHMGRGGVTHGNEEEEDEPPVPMKTRLRKQAEREREREQEREQRMPETISVSDGEEDVDCPSLWNVEQVFSYINSLPDEGVKREEEGHWGWQGRGRQRCGEGMVVEAGEGGMRVEATPPTEIQEEETQGETLE
ncbi:polyhomeotic-like protein 3, partial [Lates japonicus]